MTRPTMHKSTSPRHTSRAVGDVEPDWYRDAVIYELHVRAFADSNGDGIGDFDGLTSKLDYLADLGVTALWLLPFYPSPRRDDGYDIADYYAVNPEYGTKRSFKRFLDAAHDRNMKVITELVINHTSDQHPWFERARRAPKGSKWRNFYVWSDDASEYSDARIIFQDFETSNWTWDPVAGQYFWHRFYSHQPDLNFDNPDVEKAVLDVLDFWLDMGVDGLRLDAVPYLHEREGTSCENLAETHEVLKRIRAHMDAKYDARMLLAEANQWPEDAAAYFGDDDECHMNFHFPVMPRLFMSLQMENRTPIIDIMEQTPTPPGSCQWATFLRNHDELTLEMVTEEERDLMLRAYARDDEMRINLGIRRRLAPLLGNDRRKIELLNALLFSLPGTPVVYYGDEIGMGDNVYLGDRDGVRTPMQWSADRNAGFSSSNPHRLYLPLITEQEYHYESINVETQSNNGSSLLAWMRQLISLRNRLPVLGRGSIEFLEPDNPHVLAFLRTMEGEAPLLCVSNLSRLSQYVELDLPSHAGATPVEVFGRNRFSTIGEAPYSLTLAPYGFFWFSLEEVEQPAEGSPLPYLPGTMTEVLRRRAPLSRALAAWIPQRRWFAAKDRRIRELSVTGAVPLIGGGSRRRASSADVDEAVAMLMVQVSFTEGADQRYAVPVMRATEELAASIAQRRPGAIIARLDGDGVLVDAMSDPRGISQVVAATLSRRSYKHGAGQVHGTPRRTGVRGLADDARDITVLGVEQSNSSALVGGSLIAKLIRRVEPGVNPDVELPRHLAATSFGHVPDVAATLDADVPGESQRATVMVVHDAIDHESDLWVRVLDELSLAIDKHVLYADEVEIRDSTTTAIADLLGRRTAELHRALGGVEAGDGASPRRGAAGAPASLGREPFTLMWQRQILQSVRNATRATERELRRHRRSGALTERDDELAAQFVDRAAELVGRFDWLIGTKLEASRIRIHGDLHLGQVLGTGHDVVFIGFEGEPGMPIGQRTIKRSPLADVAGLLRSIDYAGRVAVHTATERGRIGEAELPAVERWRAGWTAQTQQQLFAAYREAIAGTGLVPDDEVQLSQLLDVYLANKCLYEVRYELANRPEWVGWPLSAVVEMLGTAQG
jgi:maltose alpha-D-glucosyltransferase/alpha-amylase